MARATTARTRGWRQRNSAVSHRHLFQLRGDVLQEEEDVLDRPTSRRIHMIREGGGGGGGRDHGAHGCRRRCRRSMCFGVEHGHHLKWATDDTV